MISQNKLNISIIIFVLFILIFYFPIIFTTQIVGNYGDIYGYYFPLKYFALTNIQKGHLPLWNPHIFSGTPFLASIQSSIFYPISILFYFLPLSYSFNIYFVFHFLVGGIGMFLLINVWNIKNKTY